MATVTRENIGTLHDKITVKLEKQDYLPSFEKTLKQYAKTANVPGFRKGMVPAGMMRRTHGQTIFNEEIVRTAGKHIDEYMKQNRLAIFGQPMIMPDSMRMPPSMDKPTDVDFSFEIGIKPDINIEPLESRTPLPRYKIAISDKLLDDETDRIKKKFGTVDEQTVVTSTNDIIYAEYQACDADGNVTADNKTEDTEAVDMLPAKLREMLMDKAPEDTLVFRPADVCTEEELPGFLKGALKADETAAEQHYKLTITKVGHLIPAEHGQELYEKVFPGGEVKDEEGFRNRLRDELTNEFARISRERLQNEMFELLVHNTSITLPVPFLKRWMREGGETPKSADQVEKEFSGFEHQLRWQLISDKIMQENQIGVTYDEVKNDVKVRVLAYFGLGADDEDEAPWIDSYMAKVTKDEKMMDETFRRLLFAKLFTFLETQFPLEEKEIAEEDFFKLGNAHDAYHAHHHHNHD